MTSRLVVCDLLRAEKSGACGELPQLLTRQFTPYPGKNKFHLDLFATVITAVISLNRETIRGDLEEMVKMENPPRIRA